MCVNWGACYRYRSFASRLVPDYFTGSILNGLFRGNTEEERRAAPFDLDPSNAATPARDLMHVTT